MSGCVFPSCNYFKTPCACMFVLLCGMVYGVVGVFTEFCVVCVGEGGGRASHMIVIGGGGGYRTIDIVFLLFFSTFSESGSCKALEGEQG